MSISYHLDETTVLAHAAGSLPLLLRIVADAHLELCPTCCNLMRQAREIGGAVLAEGGTLDVSASCKEKVMSMVGSATVHRLRHGSRAKPTEIPFALQRVVGASTFESLPWRRSGPGVQMVRLPKPANENGFLGLLKIAPGSAIPEHGHGGSELTLVLRGAYEDALGQFGPGDIADLDQGIEHEPRVIGDEPCICLAASYKPLKFRSWPARIMQRFIGI